MAEKLNEGIRIGGAALTIHAIRPLGDARGTVIDLTVAGDDQPVAWGAGRLGMVARPGTRQPPPGARGHIVFFDAKGKTCAAQDVGFDALGFPSRATIQIDAVEGVGPPVQARFFAMTWATIDVEFLLRNIPMP